MDLGALGSGVLLAALFGLTYLAYKHPSAYRKFYGALALSIVILMVVAGTWDITQSNILIRIYPYMRDTDQLYQ